jgi:hypothetical protein
MVILFLLMALIVLAMAVHLWGANSSDGLNSPEWERRQRWLGFH